MQVVFVDAVHETVQGRHCEQLVLPFREEFSAEPRNSAILHSVSVFMQVLNDEVGKLGSLWDVK